MKRLVTRKRPLKAMNVSRIQERINPVEKCGKPAIMQMSTRVTTPANLEMRSTRTRGAFRTGVKKLIDIAESD
jgi:hypothetical protein